MGHQQSGAEPLLCADMDFFEGLSEILTSHVHEKWVKICCFEQSVIMGLGSDVTF